MVRVTGFEPAASCSQSRRPTNWATPGYDLVSIKIGDQAGALPVAVPGSRCVRQSGLAPCRPRPRARLAASATGSARLAPQLGDTWKFQKHYTRTGKKKQPKNVKIRKGTACCFSDSGCITSTQLRQNSSKCDGKWEHGEDQSVAVPAGAGAGGIWGGSAGGSG